MPICLCSSPIFNDNAHLAPVLKKFAADAESKSSIPVVKYPMEEINNAAAQDIAIIDGLERSNGSYSYSRLKFHPTTLNTKIRIKCATFIVFLRQLQI